MKTRAELPLPVPPSPWSWQLNLARRRGAGREELKGSEAPSRSTALPRPAPHSLTETWHGSSPALPFALPKIYCFLPAFSQLFMERG